MGHDVDAAHEGLAGRGDHPGRQYAHSGCLSRTVGPEESVDLAHSNMQIEASTARKSVPG